MAEVQTQHSLLPARLKQSLHSMEREDDFDKELGRIPFSENTHHIPKFPDPENLTSLVEYSNKENSPKGVKNRSRIKHLTDSNQNNITNMSSNHIGNNNEIFDRPCTPNSDGPQEAPLTPTANLTVLMNAISPELRNRDKQKRSLFEDSNDTFPEIQPLDLDKNLDDADFERDTSNWKQAGSRKDKSLGLLCQKFLLKYPDCPKAHEKVTISLDEISKDLGVERRRIYDIVNVLESVEIVSRIAKNKYAWHGKTNLLNTLTKLKALGEAEGFAEQLEKIRDYEMSRDLEEQNGGTLEFPPDILKSESPALTILRKDKSLGIMSQKFLMLFLVSKPKTVNLDLAAKILIGDPNVDRTENSKFKTKIRRLYDIANILTSLNLIQKTHVTEVRGRKPAFKYVGPELDSNPDLDVKYNNSYHRPMSRHSLLDSQKNAQDSKGSLIVSTIGVNTTIPTAPGTKHEKKSFIRTASFDQICQIAEKEIIKINSLSQPASPINRTTSKGFPKSLSQDSISLLSNGGERKTGNKSVVLQKLDSKCQILEQGENSTSSNISESVQKADSNSVRIDKLIPGDKITSGVSLTQTQIEAVLKSLKEPIPNYKKAGAETVGPVKSEIMVGDKKISVRTINISANKRPASPDIHHSDGAKMMKMPFPSPPEDKDLDANGMIKQGCKGTNSLLQSSPSLLGTAKGDAVEPGMKKGRKIYLRLPDKVLQVTSTTGSNKVASPAPQVHVVQGSGMQGQAINFLTFSPPVTPKSVAPNSSTFSFTSSSQFLYSLPLTMQDGDFTQPSTAITSPLPTHLITPTERPAAPPGKSLDITPGGLCGGVYPTARKLVLKLPENSAS